MFTSQFPARMVQAATKPVYLNTSHGSIETSGVSDPGVRGAVNQDKFFMHCNAELRAAVIGVFDGHGKELGEIAAETARQFFLSRFESFTLNEYKRLEERPQQTFFDMYEACHHKIKVELKQYYEKQGVEVKEHQPEGYLLRKSAASNMYTCVRGGTTATVVVILDGGRKIIASNVGDSSAIVGTDRCVFKNEDVMVHPSTLDNNTEAHGMQEDNQKADSSQARKWLLLGGDHGAESEAEFRRVRHLKAPNGTPELQFLYDSLTSTSHRKSIFRVDEYGHVRRCPGGSYYKNVREEWATVVHAPSSAPFGDSLAFTRSLGDFYMHAFGITYEPTVVEMSIGDILADASGGNNDTTSEYTLVVASDGVWDNWTYGKLNDFVRQNMKKGTDDGCPRPKLDQLVNSLLRLNLRRAEQTFGANADNMTAVVCRVRLEEP